MVGMASISIRMWRRCRWVLRVIGVWRKSIVDGCEVESSFIASLWDAIAFEQLIDGWNECFVGYLRITPCSSMNITAS